MSNIKKLMNAGEIVYFISFAAALILLVFSIIFASLQGETENIYSDESKTFFFTFIAFIFTLMNYTIYKSNSDKKNKEEYGRITRGLFLSSVAIFLAFFVYLENKSGYWHANLLADLVLILGTAMFSFYLVILIAMEFDYTRKILQK